MTNLVSQIENVVRWLKNGCDQQSAAVELQGIADEMRAEEPKTLRRWTPCLNKDGDAEMIEDPHGAFVLAHEYICRCGLRHGSSNADGGF